MPLCCSKHACDVEERRAVPYSRHTSLVSQPLFSRCVPSVDSQLRALVVHAQKPLSPRGRDLAVVDEDIRKLFSANSIVSAAATILKSHNLADPLLRCYCATLNPLVAPQLKSGSLQCDRKSVLYRDIIRFTHYFKKGAVEWLNTVSVEMREQHRKLNLWSSEGVGAEPSVRMNVSVDMLPSEIQFHRDHLPQSFTLDDIKGLPQSVLKDGYDYMLQTLSMEFNFNHSSFPSHPRDGRISYACTEDIELLPLPHVHAVLPNDWLGTAFHKQVMCILTFYKLLLCQEQAMREIRAKKWPRDNNARGGNNFPSGTGPDRIFRECGVRLHLGDREYSKQSIKSMPSAELKSLLGSQQRNLHQTLSEREIRHVMQVVEFPYILLQAFLQCRRDSMDGLTVSLPHTRASPSRAATSPTNSITNRSAHSLGSSSSFPAVDFEMTGPLYGLFSAMSVESCFNARFYTIMEAAREILRLRTIGQAVQQLYSNVLRQNPDADALSLNAMTELVKKQMHVEGVSSAWDGKECANRIIDDVDIRCALQHCGFE